MIHANAKKLTYEELFNSTTMFYVNKSCEENINKIIDKQTIEILTGLKTIKSKETLKNYIIKYEDSLDRLTSVAEISVERFKRMVSMIRKDRGYVFGTEWSLKKIRNVMLENKVMMESILNLIWDGKNDPILQERIPSFYLDNMTMNCNTLSKLQDENTVRRLVKKSLEGNYSNMIGDAILADIEKSFKQICSKYGIEYQKDVRIPFLDRKVSFVLESSSNPKLILDVSYSVTTSSAQGSKKEDARQTEAIVKEKRAKGNNIIFVNFLDGAGWIGRQADLREIHRCSDYVLNFNNMNLLESIIDTHIDEIR